MNTKEAIRRPMPRKNKGPCTCSVCSETGSESVLGWLFCASTICVCCDSVRTTCKPIRLFFVTTYFSCIMLSNISLFHSVIFQGLYSVRVRTMKIEAIWGVTPYSLVNIYQYFQGTLCLHLHS
jgi:hypothetical protein